MHVMSSTGLLFVLVPVRIAKDGFLLYADEIMR